MEIFTLLTVKSTEAECKEWLELFVNSEYLYHIEDDAKDIYNYKTKQRTFTDEQANIVMDNLDTVATFIGLEGIWDRIGKRLKEIL